jgi:hypothetical protein
MGFTIALGTRDIATEWFHVDSSTGINLYVGQLCHKSTGTFFGVTALAAASGVSDLGGDQQILGIVVGTNNYPMTEQFNATYGQYIGTTTTMTQALQKAIQKMGVEGMHPKGDPAPMVQVALIDSTTWIRGSIVNATVGVPPTLLTVTTGDATGAGCTTNASDCTSVPGLATFCFRTGANAGIYRVVSSTSASIHTFSNYFPYAIAAGDTGVLVPYVQVASYGNINETAGFLGTSLISNKTAATNYFGLDVKSLDLTVAGRESCVFRFNTAHFGGIR